jgi:hypothetical protein
VVVATKLKAGKAGKSDKARSGSDKAGSMSMSDKMRSVILRVMSTYGPRLSITMVGIHVRPYGSAWRQVFEQMIADDIVTRETCTVDGRVLFVHTLSPKGIAEATPALAPARTGPLLTSSKATAPS